MRLPGSRCCQRTARPIRSSTRRQIRHRNRRDLKERRAERRGEAPDQFGQLEQLHSRATSVHQIQGQIRHAEHAECDGAQDHFDQPVVAVGPLTRQSVSRSRAPLPRTACRRELVGRRPSSRDSKLRRSGRRIVMRRLSRRIMCRRRGVGPLEIYAHPVNSGEQVKAGHPACQEIGDTSKITPGIHRDCWRH